MSVTASVPEPALDLWRFTAHEPVMAHVPPDGRRDLIVFAPGGGAPVCLVSALSEPSETRAIAPGDQAMGVRLRPLSCRKRVAGPKALP